MDTIHKERAGRQNTACEQEPALCSSSLTHHVLFFFSKLEKKHARINSAGAEASQRATNHSVICYFASVQGSSASSHLSSCTWGTCSISQLSPRMLHDPATAASHSGALHFLLTPALTPGRNDTHLLQMSRHILLPVASCPSQSEAWAGCLQHFSFPITLSVSLMFLLLLFAQGISELLKPSGFQSKANWHMTVWEHCNTDHEEWDPALVSCFCYLESAKGNSEE